MSTIPQIDIPEEIGKAYQCMVKTYGKEILKEPRRAVGALADLAPKMTGEVNALRVALQEKIPSLLESDRSGRKVQTENGKKAVDLLKKKGFTEEEAVSVVENLGMILGIEMDIRPDYSKGDNIPYADLPQGATLLEAVDSLNHIRWFLNKEKEYSWERGKGKLTELRRLFNSPKKNKEQIKTKYKEIVQAFSNNPYENSFLFEETRKKASFTSEQFKNYFVNVNGEPVPVEFARKYSGIDAEKALKDFTMQKKAFLEKIGKMKSQYKKSSSLERYAKGHATGLRFIFFSMVILAALGYLVKDVVLQIDIRPVLDMIKGYNYNILGLIRSYANVMYVRQYLIGCVIGIVMALIVVLLLFSILQTAVSSLKLKSAMRPLKKLNKMKEILEEEIPKKAEEMESLMKEYWKTGKNDSTFTKHDYRNKLNPGTSVKIKKMNPVRKSGKRLRILATVCCALVLFGQQKGFEESMVLGSQMLGGVPMSETLLGAGEGQADRPGKVVCAFAEADVSELSGVSRVEPVDYSQSSYLTAASAADYTVKSAIDQNDQTSWQEGAEGNGEGEAIWFALDQPYEIQYFTLKLGNWKSPESFQENGRPETMTICAGKMSATYVFPDEQREFVLKLDYPFTGSNVKFIVDGVYPGSKQADTCITDVGIYGVPKGNAENESTQMNEEVEPKAVA